MAHTAHSTVTVGLAPLPEAAGDLGKVRVKDLDEVLLVEPVRDLHDGSDARRSEEVEEVLLTTGDLTPQPRGVRGSIAAAGRHSDEESEERVGK